MESTFAVVLAMVAAWFAGEMARTYLGTRESALLQLLVFFGVAYAARKWLRSLLQG